MKNNWLKQAFPHLLAIVIFLCAAVGYNKTLLNGNVLNQTDVVGWKGGAQNAFDVKAKTGVMPLWNTHVFSGMPNYQIAMEGKTIMPDLNGILGLWLPEPMNFFFTACLCFYILAMALGLRPVVGIVTALAFAFSTYNPVIIAAGHISKIQAISFMPLLLAGLILIYNKRYWVGLSVATLGAYQELRSNHPQINYYFFIVAAAVTICYLVNWIKEKNYKHIFFAFGLSAIAAMLAFGAYAMTYTTTKEYAEYSTRGGKKVEVNGTDVKQVNTRGLDLDYALSYSMRTSEPLVMLMPHAFGGSSGEHLNDDSKVVSALVNAGVPEAQAAQAPQGLPAYWGGMWGTGEVGTSGPPYVGAIICLLALIGFVVVRHPIKWGLLAATILCILMSWGKYFPGFNTMLMEHLPLYNKFRAPSMALVIAEFCLPIMAALTLQALFFAEDSKTFLQANLKKILYTVGGLIVLTGLIYMGQNYASGYEDMMQVGNEDIKRALISGLKADRQSMFGGQIIRTILFAALVLGTIFLYLKNILKPAIAVALLGIISFIDLWVVDKKYMNDDMFIAKDEVQTQTFTKSPIDEEILKDTDPHYRVYNVAGMNEGNTSYFHRAVLGYNPAKLGIYQNVIERYFSSGQPNEQILNALDAKYILFPDQQSRQMQVTKNPNVYGAAWFVKTVKPAANEVEELQSIGHTNLRDTAIIPQSAMSLVVAPVADSTATITLKGYTNDLINYSSKSNTPQFAVLSEVYYPAGWEAFIDGKKTEIIKTDYFLRGIAVPAGNHDIKLTFQPQTVIRGNKIAYISSYLVAIAILGGFFMQWWVDRKKKTAN